MALGPGRGPPLKAPKPSGIPSRQPDAKRCSGSQGFVKSALGNGRRGSLVIPQLSTEASPTLWRVLYIRDLIPCLRYLSPPFYTAAWTGGPLPKSHQLKSGLAGVCTRGSLLPQFPPGFLAWVICWTVPRLHDLKLAWSPPSRRLSWSEYRKYESWNWSTPGPSCSWK